MNDKWTVLHWAFYATAAFALLWAAKVFAEPMAAVEQEGIRVVVYTEDCQLPEVKNLPKRATWTEKGKTIEGCAGLMPQMGMVLFYFADKTVFPMPAQMFQPVSNT
jgi:hypothetical protein